jgi:hypothetical protein
MLLKKSRAKKQLPAYLLADAHDLYQQAGDKYLDASEAFIADAASRKETIQMLTRLLAEEHQERDQALQQSELALDFAEHLTKL